MPRRRANSEQVEGDFTAMLDMIFNLLAFFMITFNPPKPEINFDLSLPPPKKIEQQTKSTEDMFAPKEELFKDVTIRLSSTPEGELAGIFVEQQKVEGLKGMKSKILSMAGSLGGATGPGADEPLDSANIIADPALKYIHLINVVDACYGLKINRINFGSTVTK